MRNKYEEQHTFGHGSFGMRCRVCLETNYYTTLKHRWWCPARWIRTFR